MAAAGSTCDSTLGTRPSRWTRPSGGGGWNRPCGCGPCWATTSPRARALVFSEGDGLSGLIVDRYGDYLVVQVTALAMAVRLPQIVPMLVDLARPQGILLRTERDIVRAEGLDLATGLPGAACRRGRSRFVDQGLRYGVDLAEGQKTGLYLDQRENRAAAARYMRGRRVLDMFCYTGGFSLAAAAVGKAREVLGFDSSQRAVAQARANAERNGLANVRFESGDAFETLHALKTAGERFDGIVLDPPKFARSRGAVDDALRAYARLEPPGPGRARAGRDPGDVQLFRPREPRRFLLHAGQRGPTERPRHPGSRAAARRPIIPSRPPARRPST